MHAYRIRSINVNTCTAQYYSTPESLIKKLNMKTRPVPKEYLGIPFLPMAIKNEIKFVKEVNDAAEMAVHAIIYRQEDHNIRQELKFRVSVSVTVGWMQDAHMAASSAL
eukprot:Pgem_evm1s11147